MINNCKSLCILCEICTSQFSKIVEGLVLECKEEGSSEICRSSVMCGVRFLRLCACNRLTEDNKEEELVELSPRWGLLAICKFPRG